ncbi:MAG: hypothetical protein HY033_05040 [Ignavibacteriae bacterium]|nr:hypothetical protein [Ignavibacteria bacterium]MBI3364256.1 hypothetical protein [Ignavibacteriota bacterium]
MIFFVLGLITGIYPFIAAAVYSEKLEPRTGLFIHVLSAFTYILVVFGMGFRGWWDLERKANHRWEEIRKGNE